MGQCMSRKAAGAFAASATAAHNKPTKMQKHSQLQSPGEGDDKDPSKRPHLKGVATSFGFRRRPTTAPAIASNSLAARRLASCDVMDRNGNAHADTASLTSNVAPTGRSTPKLIPPKKEGIATRVNRFGFRQPQVNRLSKVADLNNGGVGEFCNNNGVRVKSVGLGNVAKEKKGGVGVMVDSNKNRMKIGVSQPQAEKFMLQSTQLPRPEPIRVIETKAAKTMANNCRKSTYHEDNSSKEGSLTEDSGVGSQTSADVVPGVERLSSSPTYGARRIYHKTRNLEIVRSGGNTFDVRDLDDSSESCAPLPQLPSAFGAESSRGNVYNHGLVREKAREYQKHLLSDSRRKISVTSSEGFSDDNCDEEKTLRDKLRSEKTFVKTGAQKFLKSKPEVTDSSFPSSDEHEWCNGGEAMADEVSFSISSSDESRDKDQPPFGGTIVQNVSSALQDLMVLNSPKPDVKNVFLTIEDPKFAALAASTNSSLLLDDETSPVDSLISYSESEEILKRKIDQSSSISKDINEKLTPPSPGTPTNATNSLSLSDGKDDFLIDDEIADQPALVFEETLVANNDNTFSISQNNSESTNTMVDSTPKPKRRSFLGVEGSPLALRKKKSLHNRTISLDTLSPCESIASDDLMMDYDYSQSSGLEDDKNENHTYGFSSLDETVVRKMECDDGGAALRDWSSLLGNYMNEKNAKSVMKNAVVIRTNKTTELRYNRATAASETTNGGTQICKTPTASPKPTRSEKGNASKTTRLLWSRTGTPDSPKSVDSKSTTKSRQSVTNSPLRLSKYGPLSSTGYDSDDSIRLDRANHSAMKQDIMSIKTMLLKLRRVLNESDTHIPFDGQMNLTNGLFNGLCSSQDDAQNDDTALELAELRRQVLFLQGQLEDKEKTVQELQEQMVRFANESNSAPASTIVAESSTCNAATQTERIRPISAGPSLVNGSPTESSNIGSLVSASEPPHQRRSRPPPQNDPNSKKSPTKLWRKPGEPPSPQRYTGHSSIPRRANSRTRTAS